MTPHANKKMKVGEFLGEARPQFELSVDEHIFWIAAVGAPNEEPKVADQNAARLRNCWNACIGMEHPEECIADLKAALKKADFALAQLGALKTSPEHFAHVAIKAVREVLGKDEKGR